MDKIHRLEEWKHQAYKGNTDFIYDLFELVEELKSDLHSNKLDAEIIVHNGYDETAMEMAERIIERVESALD